MFGGPTRDSAIGIVEELRDNLAIAQRSIRTTAINPLPVPQRAAILGLDDDFAGVMSGECRGRIDFIVDARRKIEHRPIFEKAIFEFGEGETSLQQAGGHDVRDASARPRAASC